MRRTYAFLGVIFLWVYLLWPVPGVFGTELDFHGHFFYTYERYNQAGRNGFFGPYNVDNGAGTRVANLNFWNGGQFDTNFVSGSDAGWIYSEGHLHFHFQVNSALRATCEYRIASFGEPVSEDYLAYNNPGVNTAISEGQWTILYVTAQTPWGQVAFGKRRWGFGIGLQYDGESSVLTRSPTTETLLLNAPYGPFDIGIGFSPFRYVGRSSNDLVFDELGDPFNLIEVTPGVERRYYSRADKSGRMSRDLLGYLLYQSGSVQIGLLGVYGAFHLGPEASLAAQQRIAQDSMYTHGALFLKYFDGRFFLNGEAAWLYWTDRYADPDGLFVLNGIPNTTRYTEQWKHAVEAGFLAGPAKLTLLHAWTPGPDRRNGGFIDRQPAAFIWHPSFDRWFSNQTLFWPYSAIFAWDYGSGLNAYNLGGWGYIRDAWVLAARLDYAVASNWNIFVSVIRPERTSKGYGWGCLSPASPTAPDGNISFNFNGRAGSPNIPDTSLGYEVNWGFEWQLLEGWRLWLQAGYWQPGNWFSYACIDRSVTNWNVPGAENFGTRPGKKIDPVYGGTIRFQVDF
jgi:hypothetical protein